MGWEVGGGVSETPEKGRLGAIPRKVKTQDIRKGRSSSKEEKQTNKTKQNKTFKLVIQRKFQFQPRKLELVVE